MSLAFFRIFNNSIRSYRSRSLKLFGVVLIGTIALISGCAKQNVSTTGVARPGLNYVLDTSWPHSSEITFNEISWMEVDHSTRQIYLLQRARPPVSVWTPGGDLTGLWHTEALGSPHSITLHTESDGKRIVWITDMAPPQTPAGMGYGHCLKKFSIDGQLIGTIGTCGKNSQGTGIDPVQFDKVTDVAFDSEGYLFVTDGDLNGLNNRVLKMTPQGDVIMDWSAPGNKPGSGPREFNLPHAVHVDECDRVWIADALNHRIQVISNQGDYYGELACFGDYGVYGMAFSNSVLPPPNNRSKTLFATTSPTDGGNRGTVYVFNAPMNCSQPREIGNCNPLSKWDINLPPTTQTAMLHDVTASRNGDAIYVSELGGTLPPQKWVKQSSIE